MGGVPPGVDPPVGSSVPPVGGILGGSGVGGVGVGSFPGIDGGGVGVVGSDGWPGIPPGMFGLGC